MSLENLDLVTNKTYIDIAYLKYKGAYFKIQTK